MPIVPALIVGGLILAIKNLLVNYCGFSTDGGTAQVLLAIFDAAFTFLPVWIGYQLASILKMQPIMGALLGAIMVSPSISGVEGLDFLRDAYSGDRLRRNCRADRPRRRVHVSRSTACSKR